MANKKIQVGTLYLSGNRDKLEVKPVDGKKFTLKELQMAVEGYIELMSPAVRGTTVYVNEDGALKRLPPNRHTWEFADKRVYLLNGYTEAFRVAGNALAVRNVDPHNPNDPDHPSTYGLPTIAQFMGKK